MTSLPVVAPSTGLVIVTLAAVAEAGAAAVDCPTDALAAVESALTVRSRLQAAINEAVTSVMGSGFFIAVGFPGSGMTAVAPSCSTRRNEE